MYPSMRVFFYALNLLAWSLLVFVGTTPVVSPALAAPVPLPMYRNADFAPRLPSNASAPAPPTSSAARRQLPNVLEELRKLGGRDDTNILSNIAILNTYYTGMEENVKAFSECLVNACWMLGLSLYQGPCATILLRATLRISRRRVPTK